MWSLAILQMLLYQEFHGNGATLKIRHNHRTPGQLSSHFVYAEKEEVGELNKSLTTLAACKH